MAVRGRTPEIEAVAILFLILGWIFVSLRCYVRAIMIKNFGTDDWLAVIALIIFTVYCSFIYVGTQYGAGKHVQDIVPLSKILIAVKWWWWCEIGYVACTTVLKASICIFIHRICGRKSHKVIIWVVLGVVIVFSTMYFFMMLFQCRPIDFFWTQYKGATGGKCISIPAIVDASYAHSAISAIADWTMGIMPIFIIRDSAMSRQTKIIVGIILALGALGSTATIVRLPYLKLLLDTADFLYLSTDVAIWSIVEPGMGLTASSMATLRPLFRSSIAHLEYKNSNATKETSSTATSGPMSYFHRRGSSAMTRKDVMELFDVEDGRQRMGVTTVVSSSPIRSESRRSGLMLWNSRAGPLYETSSGEILPIQNPDWDVRKTTDVMTRMSPEPEVSISRGVLG